MESDKALEAYQCLTGGMSMMEVARQFEVTPDVIIKSIRTNRDSFVNLGKGFDNEILKTIEYDRLEMVQVKLGNLINSVSDLGSYDDEAQAKILSSVGNVATAFTRISERKAKIAGFDEPVETRNVVVNVTPEKLLEAATSMTTEARPVIEAVQ